MNKASVSGDENLEERPEMEKTEEETKGEITNAIKYAKTLLHNLNLLTDTPPSTISNNSIAIGEEISTAIQDLLSERRIIITDELIDTEEVDESGEFEACPGKTGDDEDYVAEEFVPAPADYVPLSYKERAVALAAAHPKWSLKSLQSHGVARLKHKTTLYRWKEDVKKGGTHFDKWKTIDMETYERFVEARQNSEQVTTQTLQQWAMNAAFPFLSEKFNFVASHAWVERFKKNHKIRQRKVTKFVSAKEFATVQEALEVAKLFRLQTKLLIPNFDLDYVLNTDQNGCQYESTFDRSLPTRGEKAALVKKKHLNKDTHSYTAQYTLTASGKLLPYVFLCMQETSGQFGPTVKKRLDEISNRFKNVIVNCTKSGKLTKVIYREFLKTVILPYVGYRKFLYIIDSWEGQTDQTLYDQLFVDDKKACTCTVKIIPPKCTPFCQPCDVYFYRQIKFFIKKLQNAPELLKKNKEINSREDAIKIHSLILHQLSAPAFSAMIKYAWFAARLIDERPIFLNLNEQCFPVSLLKNVCNCKALAFIKCAWCSSTLCFDCFYEKYHPEFCIGTPSDASSSL